MTNSFRTQIGREKVEQTMLRIRDIVSEEPQVAELRLIRDQLVELGQDSTLFPESCLTDVSGGPLSKPCLFQIYVDSELGFTLYLNFVTEPLASPIHDHGTWAVIAGIRGGEKNTFYEQDDNGVPKPVGEVVVESGTGVSLDGRGLHSIEIERDFPVLNLHLYGQPMPSQSARRQYNSESGEWGSYGPQVPIVDLTN